MLFTLNTKSGFLMTFQDLLHAFSMTIYV